jgi:hypothetical protein
MEALIAFLSTFGFWQIVLLIILLFTIFLIYTKATESDVYTEIYEIKERKRAELWNFVRQELIIIESESIERTRIIIKELEGDQTLIMKLFTYAIERSSNELFENIKLCIRINGFHSKTGADLDQYIVDTATSLLSKSRLLISERVPELNGYEDRRYTIEDAVKHFRKIILKSIEIRKEEQKLINDFKNKSSIVYRINNLMKKFKN